MEGRRICDVLLVLQDRRNAELILRVELAGLLAKMLDLVRIHISHEEDALFELRRFDVGLSRRILVFRTDVGLTHACIARVSCRADIAV